MGLLFIFHVLNIISSCSDHVIECKALTNVERMKIQMWGGQCGMFCFQDQGRRARIQEWVTCTTDQWWQITYRPLDEKTFQGTLWWGEVAAITTSHILKINTCFHTRSFPEVNSFSQAGHPVADPYFWNVGGQETSVAPRGDWGTVLLI